MIAWVPPSAREAIADRIAAFVPPQSSLVLDALAPADRVVTRREARRMAIAAIAIVLLDVLLVCLHGDL
jgi:hypothetical protein